MATETVANEVVPEVVAAEPEKKSNRVQLSEVIECKLSTSRLRAKLTDTGLNVDVARFVDEFVDELGGEDKKTVVREGAKTFAQLSAECRRCVVADLPSALSPEKLAKSKPDEVQHAQCVELLRRGDEAELAGSDQVALLKTAKSLVKSQLVRNSDSGTVTFTATMNYVLSRLAEHGCEQLKLEGKKTLRPYHMVSVSAETTDVWPLLRDLRCVRDVRDARQASLDEQARLADEKKERKKKDKAVPKDAAAPKPDKKEKKPKEPKQPWSDFVHHTSLIFKEKAKQCEFEMSADVKNFGARLLSELCDSYVRRLRVLVSFSGAKTIKPQTIDCATDLCLVECGVDGRLLHAYVSHRLALFQAHKSLAKKNGEPVVVADS